MLLTYYALRALAEEWNALLQGATIGEAYTQSRAELALALFSDNEEQTVFVRFSNPLRCLFRRAGHSRARRNVASVLDGGVGARIAGMRIAERDRVLFLDLTDGRYLQIIPFGPRPNVFLCDREARVLDAFLNAHSVQGQPAPPPRPAPRVDTPDAFAARWPGSSPSLEQAVARAIPLFDRLLSREAVVRAEQDPSGPAAIPEVLLEQIWRSSLALENSLTSPSPCIYRTADAGLQFSLLPLQHLPVEPEARYPTVDVAAERFARAYLSEHAFRVRFEPLHRALSDAHDRQQRGLERMQHALASGSRADQYEHWAHVLMAQPHRVPLHADEVVLPDVFEPGEQVRVPLRREWSAIQNAESLYEKARQTRAARAHAQHRVEQAQAEAARLATALEALKGVQRWPELKQFESDHADLLERLPLRTSSQETEGPRFRQFDLHGGYHVLVGKNAAQNEALTFHHASRHDYWLHARGVAGSHVILRTRGRNDEPPSDVREAAASIAAYYSKASGSELVPVIITPRKYVRKPRKSTPGSVLVEREQVLIVPPKLPASD